MKPLRPRHHVLLLAMLLAGAVTSVAQAEEQPDPRWRLCPTPIIFTPQQQLSLQQIPPDTTIGYADTMSADAQGLIRLDGRVQLERQGIQLFSDHAEYDREADQLQLDGSVILRSEGMELQGSQASYRPAQQSGQFSDANFFIAEGHSFGGAGSVRIRDGQRLELSQLSYTTCPPEKPDWLLRAGRLKINPATNTGEAYHATLRFKGVPFFYSPYLNFPLSGRKSGLLPPSVGQSDLNGTDITLPLYWNIAPNRDATLSPRHLAKRGTMLGAEFRFLEQHSSGELKAAWLGNDRLREEDRSALRLQHQARISSGWHSDLFYRRVSDVDFYRDDLGSSGESRNESHLERRLDLRYDDRHWQFLARAQEYQTLIGTSPYQRLPQLRLRGTSSPQPFRLHYRLDSEAVSFRHEAVVPTGERVDLKPALALPMVGTAWYLTPSLAWRHTEYRLQDHEADARPSRSLPISSLDGGLVFERPLVLGGHTHTQTLEPRLFYLHVPYREQESLPLFDTELAPFSFASLFRDNRFAGADRQGDANQLTAALSSRLLDDGNGREVARAAIAQASYFEQPRVTLSGVEPEQTRRRSDLFGELALSPIQGLSMHVTEQWNPDQRRIEQLSSGLRYSPRQGSLLYAGYRYYRPEELKQAEIAALWPLGQQWRILARHQRDLDYRRTLSSVAGLEYESCCWMARLIGQERRHAIDDSISRSIMLTLELKGLGSLGQTLEQALGRGLLDKY